ncbi:unnamed protein product [Leuciscus chuanchicus]
MPSSPRSPVPIETESSWTVRPEGGWSGHQGAVERLTTEEEWKLNQQDTQTNHTMTFKTLQPATGSQQSAAGGGCEHTCIPLHLPHTLTDTRLVYYINAGRFTSCQRQNNSSEECDKGWTERGQRLPVSPTSCLLADSEGTAHSDPWLSLP